MIKALRTVGRYIMLMGRTFSRPERMRMFFRQYIKEIEQLGVNYRHRAVDFILHRSGDHHPDKIKHRKPMDAPLDGGIRHPRDSSA